MIQVYCDNKLVGHVNYALPEGSRTFTLVSMDASAAGFLDEGAVMPVPAVTRQTVYELKVRGVSVPIEDRYIGAHTHSEMLELAKKSYQIPDDAVCDKQTDSYSGTMTYRFRWRALDLDIDQYEALFDHPWFEPIHDGTPDPGIFEPRWRGLGDRLR